MVTSGLGACEWFVWDLRRSGLIDRGQLDATVGEFLKQNPQADASALADYLVQHGTITPFQAERILNGKTQGLALGPYVLLDAIGTGSMGQVYKASSKNDAGLYAVKVLPQRSTWNVRLVRRQVRSFANFSHPAVVPLVDVGTAGGLHYLVWPLAEGQTLDTLMRQAGKLAPALAAVYGVQVAQGLAAAHQNGLFHGLVKPSNVLVGPDGQARLLDFGIGALLVENEWGSEADAMLAANPFISGLDFISPESTGDSTDLTPAGDQYSLGCVLYYCLTGRVPFPASNMMSKLLAHQTKEPRPIRELSPGVPEGLCRVVARLMSKAPKDRYAGCDEVAEALEPFRGDRPAAPAATAEPPPPGPARAPGSPLRRVGEAFGRLLAPFRRPAGGSSPAKTPWFVAERSEARAGLLLTARADVRVSCEQRLDDGADFAVEVNPGNASAPEVFEVLARGTLSADPRDWLRSVEPLFPADGHAGGRLSRPACVFVINVRDGRAGYAWLAEPLVEAAGATLRSHPKVVFADLDATAVHAIVDRVKAWYDARRGTPRPA
jgi:serine/threonine protein kinase